MNVPSFLDIPAVERREDGKYYWTDEWRSILMQLFQELQLNFSNEGLVSPSQTTANIALLLPPETKNGTIIYDTTSDNFKGFEGGVWKTFTLT